MKLLTSLQALIASCALIAIQASAGIVPATPAAAPPVTFELSNGFLKGAKNVSIDGTLYDVAFVRGSCDEAFASCDNTAFAFRSEESALLAAQALVDQVFAHHPVGQDFHHFIPDDDSIVECTYFCYTLVPFDYDLTTDLVASAHVYNNFAHLSVGSGGTLESAGEMLHLQFAVFKPASGNVPEPGSIALLGLAIAGLALARRRIATP